MNNLDPKSLATTKTVIFNVLMCATALGGLKFVSFTPEELQVIAGAFAVVWTVGAVILRRFTNRPAVVGPLPKGSISGVILLPFLVVGLLLGGCASGPLVGGPGALATDKRLAQAEAVLAAGNAVAQTLIADGTIPAKYAPKVQASIDAAQLALAQAKQALADGKLDANDAIAAALTAAIKLPAVVAEFQR